VSEPDKSQTPSCDDDDTHFVYYPEESEPEEPFDSTTVKDDENYKQG